MSFSHEDKSAWISSEVMREFEKIAEDIDLLNGLPEEAYSPIGMDEKDEEEWEEEADLEAAVGDAAGELVGEPKGLVGEVSKRDDIDEILGNEDGDLKNEFASLYMNNLLSNLQDMAHDFGEQGHSKVALAIERTINSIRAGGNNA